MNIHEHQAKEILKKNGALVPEGFLALSVEELDIFFLLFGFSSEF